jgi:glycosyl transferase, family 25
MRCFVINLDTDTGRMSHMHDQLLSLDIPYTRLSGVRGSLLTVDQTTELCDQNKSTIYNGAALSLGEIGCAASHMALYKQIVAENIPYALVLEDDVSLPANFKEILTSVTSARLIQFDYLSFDYGAYGFDFLTIWFPGVKAIYKSKTGYKKHLFACTTICKFFVIIVALVYEELQKVIFKNTIVTPIRSLYFTGCYIVTKQGAEKLLNVSEKIIYPADKLPNIARIKHNLNFKIYTPLIVKQLTEQFVSNIGFQK